MFSVCISFSAVYPHRGRSGESMRFADAIQLMNPFKHNNPFRAFFYLSKSIFERSYTLLTLIALFSQKFIMYVFIIFIVVSKSD